MAKQKRDSSELQERAVRRMKLGDNVNQMSQELRRFEYSMLSLGALTCYTPAKYAHKAEKFRGHLS